MVRSRGTAPVHDTAPCTNGRTVGARLRRAAYTPPPPPETGKLPYGMSFGTCVVHTPEAGRISVHTAATRDDTARS